MANASETYHCESCHTDVANPSSHENRYHDGAQTCWTVAERAIAA